MVESTSLEKLQFEVSRLYVVQYSFDGHQQKLIDASFIAKDKINESNFKLLPRELSS